MIPGGPRSNRELQHMMKRLGMSSEPVDDVEEVIVRTAKQEHVFKQPEVTILTVQGVRTYQIVGDAVVRPRRASAGVPEAGATEPAVEDGPSEEDVKLVMDQAGVDRAEALEALRAADGAPAEAILAILSRRT